MGRLVMKFGGTSVADIARIRNVAAIPGALQVLLALICWQHPPADLQLSWLPTLGLSLDHLDPFQTVVG